jgi:hypothetical protein
LTVQDLNHPLECLSSKPWWCLGEFIAKQIGQWFPRLCW